MLATLIRPIVLVAALLALLALDVVGLRASGGDRHTVGRRDGDVRIIHLTHPVATAD